MANFVDYSYSSDSGDSDTFSKPNCLDFSYAMMNSDALAESLEAILVGGDKFKDATFYESMILRHNRLDRLPEQVMRFPNLKIIDLSGNSLTALPEWLLTLEKLNTLVVKNNYIMDDGIPKDLNSSLKEVNFSGNTLTRFPEQLLELDRLKFLYLGSNRIPSIPSRIGRLRKLKVLYLGGNRLTEIPAEVGQLQQLQALVLSENMLESLPSSIAQLKKLRSLLLHRNQLTTLPPQIIALRELMELSLRDNPLVVRFVRDLTYNPPNLLELAARVVKSKNVPYDNEDLPMNLSAYLDSAHKCVNPKCQGVYFDSRVEHVKFVDFCGKYRIPLLQYLCSPSCTKQPVAASSASSSGDSDSDDGRLKKVLLG